MKRLSLVAIFALFIALCVSAAYWGMQLFKPPLRQVAAPQQASKAEVNLDAAVGLLGGHMAVAAAVSSNFQLKGVVLAGRAKESIAILSTDGKPAQAIMVNTEAAPGVTVKEVHAQYILLSEGGVTKRVELPENALGTTAAKVGMVNISSVPAQTAPAAVNNAVPPVMQSPPALGTHPTDAGPDSGVPGGSSSGT